MMKYELLENKHSYKIIMKIRKMTTGFSQRALYLNCIYCLFSFYKAKAISIISLLVFKRFHEISEGLPTC